MKQGLFRKNAVEYQKHTLHGEVLVKPSVPHIIITLFITSWVIFAIIWLCSNTYTKKETVKGWIEPSSGLIKVFPGAHGGKISQILVNEGDSVKAGQTLFIIENTTTLVDDQILNHSLLKEYKLQKIILHNQLTQSKEDFLLEMAQVENKISYATQSKSLLEKQLATAKSRYSLVKNRSRNYFKVKKKGFISEDEFSSIEEEKLALLTEIQSLERTIIEQENHISELKGELSLLPSRQNTKTSRLESDISDIEQSIARLSSDSATKIKATRSGYVSNLQAKLGQNISLNIPLLSIVPDNSDMQAQLLVPVRSAGFIEEGQQLSLRYDAFPYQKFGVYSGRITKVSRSLLLPNEVDNSPIAYTEPSYLVKAVLESNTIQAYGHSIHLKPGITFSADIKLSERTLAEWLLEPIYSLKGRI